MTALAWWVQHADATLAALLSCDAEPGREAAGPRRLMSMIKAAAACSLAPGSQWAGHPEPIRAAKRWVVQLAGLQRTDGLFDVEANIASPPDSAFVVNDLGVVYALLGEACGLSEPVAAWGELREHLYEIAARSQDALLAGGVHTPNHRWELAAALVRLDQVVGGDLGARRARQWLAEGIDIDADGLYSERSPNYAANVSNPCLLILGDVLDAPDLTERVHRNLHSMIDLTDGDEVETVLSRRQDQHSPFPTGPFALQWRRFAVRQGCVRCARHAAQAETADGFDPVDAIAQTLLDPGLADPLPPSLAEDLPIKRVFGLGLMRRRDEHGTITVYAGSDVPDAGRIASGLACNPTFLRMRSGRVFLDSVRLSRQFFGLGPFRATSWRQEGDAIVLTEEVGAAYYLPINASEQHPDGNYDLQFEGRFAAKMSFAERLSDRVTLRTEARITTTEGSVLLDVEFSGACVPYALELAFRPGGVFTGAVQVADDQAKLSSGAVGYRVGDDELRVARTELSVPAVDPVVPAFYHPGEAYTATGGTDALTGPRLYLTGRTDRPLQLAIGRVTPASRGADG